jgi:hypothetical protein
MGNEQHKYGVWSCSLVIWKCVIIIWYLLANKYTFLIDTEKMPSSDKNVVL